MNYRLNFTWILVIYQTFLIELNYGDGVFLTPLIRNNSIELARNLSCVNPDLHGFNISSYSGFITVNDEYDSNLWFWYFPVDNKDIENAPLIIWLQGGPGTSALYGLFEELGPFSVDDNGDLKGKPYSWHLNHNLLFIDNPVGTGFSFTNDSKGYATNQTQISEQLYSFTIQFLKVFPELQRAPLYLSGESYGGKHVISFGYEIHKNNPEADMKINLKGMAIGNGYMDPVSDVGHGDYLYQLGFIDDENKNKIEEMERNFLMSMQNGEYDVGSEFAVNFENVLVDHLGGESLNNYREEDGYSADSNLMKYIEKSKTKLWQFLHVGNASFSLENYNITDYLGVDFVMSVKPLLEKLLEHYKVMLYSGQLDTICPYVVATKMYRSLNWSGSNDYLNATREPWYMDDKLVGFSKRAGNFMEVLVRNGGHSVPKDQPERSLLLIESFINDVPLNNTLLKSEEILSY